jgi:hypothetical protein
MLQFGLAFGARHGHPPAMSSSALKSADDTPPRSAQPDAVGVSPLRASPGVDVPEALKPDLGPTALAFLATAHEIEAQFRHAAADAVRTAQSAGVHVATLDNPFPAQEADPTAAASGSSDGG